MRASSPMSKSVAKSVAFGFIILTVISGFVFGLLVPEMVVFAFSVAVVAVITAFVAVAAGAGAVAAGAIAAVAFAVAAISVVGAIIAGIVAAGAGALAISFANNAINIYYARKGE